MLPLLHNSEDSLVNIRNKALRIPIAVVTPLEYGEICEALFHCTTEQAVSCLGI